MDYLWTAITDIPINKCTVDQFWYFSTFNVTSYFLGPVKIIFLVDGWMVCDAILTTLRWVKFDKLKCILIHISISTTSVSPVYQRYYTSLVKILNSKSVNSYPLNIDIFEIIRISIIWIYSSIHFSSPLFN